MIRILLTCLLALVLAAACALRGGAPTGGAGWTVTRIVDGDTIDVRQSGQSHRVRLLGIDTPETVDPRRPVQCFGKEASRKATELLSGKLVRLDADASQDEEDAFGRLLRYVFLASGEHVNLILVRQGFAHEYTYRLPYKYQAEFKAAQREAEQEQVGLWSPSTCNGDTERAA